MYTLLDLKQIASELGGHFSKYDLDNYTGQCQVCWSEVSQDVNECPDCGTPVVWANSKVWSHLYGSHKSAIAELEMVLPETVSGEFLMKACRLQGFPNASEQQDWAKAERWFGESEMRSIVQYVTRDKRGKAALAHALATARKKLREERPKKDKQTADIEPATSML
jgi:hypothetical protein